MTLWKALIASVLVPCLTVGVSAGRTQKITLEVHSSPEGAQVFIDDVPRLMGSTPLALTYHVAKPCGPTQAVRVRWASGAEASQPALQLCAKTGKRQQYTFERPADVAGLQVDLQVAYQQAMIAQMQAQTNELNELSYQGWLQTLNAGQRAVVAPKPFALCVSRDVAHGVVYVACQ